MKDSDTGADGVLRIALAGPAYTGEKVTEIYNKVTESDQKVTELQNSLWIVL